jgi:hypothetical protein
MPHQEISFTVFDDATFYENSVVKYLLMHKKWFDYNEAVHR